MPGVRILWSKKKIVITFQQGNGNTFTLLFIFIVKSLQKEQNSTNLLLWPPICMNKPAITPKWFNSLDTNSRADSTYPHISWYLKILSLCLPIIQICHFQNIHLVKTWLPQLEKQMEKLSENAHDKYRLFLSAEPASKPENHIIPQVSFWKLQALKSKMYCKSI